MAVLGAGSWGTALADLLARKGVETVLWSYEPEVAQGINRHHRNPRYLTEPELDPRLAATDDFADALGGAGAVLLVSPSHVTRSVLEGAHGLIGKDALIVSATKGIENETLMTMQGVIGDVISPQAAERACFLSGPSFALEVARGSPTAVSVGSRDAGRAARTQRLFQTGYFRVYTNPDARGVELGGALKNVMAIAAGVVDGLELGAGARAALITRGLAEMTRLGVALGADPMTFSGLAGMGDLILTSTGDLSRNRRVGLELGRGRTLEEILAGMSEVAEGVRTTTSARALAHRAGVEMPVVEEVHALLFEGKDPRAAAGELMTREPRSEQWH